MKILKNLMIAILMITALAIGASATDSSYLDMTEVEFQGYAGKTVKADFTITYTGIEKAGIKKISSDLGPEYNVKFSKGMINTELKKGQTKTFSMYITIPSNYEADEDLIGNLKLEVYEVIPFVPPRILKTSSEINLKVLNPSYNPNSQYIEVSPISFTGYETVNASFTIKNLAETITSATILVDSISITPLDYKIKDIQLSTNLGNEYNVKFSDKPSEILPGEEKTINMEITIPNGVSVGTHDIIGKLIVNSGVYETEELAFGTTQDNLLVETTETSNINIEKTENPAPPPEASVPNSVPLGSIKLEMTNVHFQGWQDKTAKADFTITYTGNEMAGIKKISSDLGSEYNVKFSNGIINKKLTKNQPKTFSMYITIPDTKAVGQYPALGLVNLEVYEVSPFAPPQVIFSSSVIDIDVWDITYNIDSAPIDVSSVLFTGYETVTSSFTIKNTATGTGNYPKIKNINLNTNLDNIYNVKFSNKPSEILPGEEKTINMEMTIPNGVSVGTHNIIGKLIVVADVYQESNAVEIKAGSTTETSNINIEKTEEPTLETNFTLTSITLGSGTQERGEYDTKTITITNTGTEELTTFEFSSTADPAYEITFEDKPTTALAPGASIAVTVKGLIPLNFDSGEKSIGEISVKATSTEGEKTVTSDLRMQSPSILAIEKIKIDCDGKRSTVDENDVVDEDIAPGDVCSVEITISNNHNTIDFDDVDIELDGDSDLEGESDSVSIDAGEEETITLELTIDEDADSQEYDAYVIAEGQDDNGVNHEARIDFKIKVERAKHDIQIKTIKINPREVALCKTTEINLQITLYNNGEKREKDAGLEIRVPGLSYTKIVEDIIIDDEDEFVVRVVIPLTKATYSGSYNILLTSLYDDVKQSDTETETFTVIDGCPSQVVLPPTDTDGNEGISAAENTSKFDSVLTVILLLANLAVASTLGVLGFKLFKDIKKLKQ